MSSMASSNKFVNSGIAIVMEAIQVLPKKHSRRCFMLLQIQTLRCKMIKNFCYGLGRAHPV